MQDPNELYQLEADVPELGRPVLIQALTGFVDAGDAGRLAREHLLAKLDVAAWSRPSTSTSSSTTAPGARR